jgi:zeaxanthin glucosyltransferase
VHLGVISIPVGSHVSVLGGLAMRLRQRGHRVTFFHIADVEPMVRRARLDFCRVGGAAFPVGTMAARDEEISRLTGLAGFRFTIAAGLRYTEMLLDEAPAAITAAGIDMLLVDQSEAAGSTLAEHLALPFITVACALPLPESADDSVPPFFVGWPYRPGILARVRNRLALRGFMYAVRPFFTLLNRKRTAWGLRTIEDQLPEFARRALIAQLPACMDFPQRRMRADVHHCGPFTIETARPDVPFPWDRIDGRPLVYAAFGNQAMTNHRVVRAIAEASWQLDMQAVIALGRFVTPAMLGSLPGDPILVTAAPQLDLIERAELVVHHGGVNTSLEALWHGVPAVAVPMINDQPGMAARIEWAGAGLVLAPKRVTAENLRAAMQRLRSEPRYKQAAFRLKSRIRAADGLNRAADIVERALPEATERRVLQMA